MYPIVIFFLLLLNWVILSGKFDAFHLGLGVISCLVVTFISHDLLYHDRKKGLGERLAKQVHFFATCLGLHGRWLRPIFMFSNWPQLKPAYEEMSPRVVTFETYLKTDFAKFVLANSITLTPGTITMLIRGDIFHVHTMSQFLEDDLLTGAIERKVAEVFEPEVLESR